MCALLRREEAAFQKRPDRQTMAGRTGWNDRRARLRLRLRRSPLVADSFQICCAVLSLIHPLPIGLMADTPVGPMVLATSGQDWQRTLRPTHQVGDFAVSDCDEMGAVTHR